MNRSGKGRGKLALKVVGASEQMVQIPVEDVLPSPYQPRVHFDKEKLKEMAVTIKRKGRLIHAIAVRPSPKKAGKYELVGGERRLLATKLAKLPTVSAVVRNLTDEEAAEEVSISNLQQESLTPPEEGNSIKTLLDMGKDLESIAERLGKSVPYLQARLKLLELPTEVQEMVSEEKINLAHAEVLHELPTAKDQKSAAKMAHSQHLTAVQLKARTQHRRSTPSRRTSVTHPAYTHQHLSKEILALHANLAALEIDPQLPDQKRQTLAKQIGVLIKALEKIQASLAKKSSAA